MPRSNTLPRGWRVRDLGSTNGTFLNGARLSTSEHPIRKHDIIRFGNVTVVVDLLRDGTSEEEPANPESLQVETCMSNSFEDALQGLLFDTTSSPRPGQQLLALLRAGHHLGHLESEEELLHTILNDAVCTLEAQRGAIVLADGRDGHLASASAGDRSKPGRQPARLQSKSGPTIISARRIDPVQRRGGSGLAGAAQHRRRHHGISAVRAAADAAQTPRRSAPRPRADAKAVHQGGFTPWRRPCRPCLGWHRRAPICSKDNANSS